MEKLRGIDVAKKYIGQTEKDEYRNLNMFLEDHATNKDIKIDVRITPWCAAFVNACERCIGNPGNGKLLALSFKSYGTDVEDWNDDVKEGDIVCFVFPDSKPGHGHVSYFSDWDDSKNTVRCLGGNQKDAVRYADYNQDHIVAIRRPPQ